MKKIQFGAVLLIAIMMSAALAYAQEHSQHNQMMQMPTDEQKQAAASGTSKGTVNVGNKICPVSGEKINEETKATYEYEGKVYNFCCPMCIDEFKKDPQKYIKKVEGELQAASKEEESGQKQ